MSNSDDPPKPLRTLIGRPIPKLDPPGEQPAEPAPPAPLPGLTPSVILPPGGDTTIPMGSSSLREALNAALANPATAVANMDAVRAARGDHNPASTTPMGSAAIRHAAEDPALGPTSIGKPPTPQQLAAASAGKGPLAATTRGSPPSSQQLAEAIAKAANDTAERAAADRSASIANADRGRPPTGPNPPQPGYPQQGSNPAQPTYGAQPGSNPAQPYAQQPGSNPAQPTYGAQPGSNPAQPYAQQPGSNPAQPYAQQPGSNPAQPYAQQPGSNPAQPYAQPGSNPAQPMPYGTPGSNPAQAVPPNLGNPANVAPDSMFARQKSPTGPNPGAFVPGAGSNLVVPQGYTADPTRARPPTAPNPAVDPTAMAMNAPGYATDPRARPPTGPSPAVDPNAFAAKPGSNPGSAAYDPGRAKPPTGPSPAVDPNAFAAKPGSTPGSAAYPYNTDPRARPPTDPNPNIHNPTMFTAPGAQPQYAAPSYPLAAPGVTPHDATMMAAPASMVPTSSEPRPRISTDPIRSLGTETLREVPTENYEISDEIARGGMGRILRAKDVRLHRQVAIKELLGNNAHFKARFERETLITARLQHPAIVPIYDAGRWPTGELFYTMKLVAGKPLETLIDNVVTMRDRIALLPNMIAVAEALAYAHSNNVVHRDLKPANILVGDFGETIVIDWGLAKDLTTNDAAEPAGPFRSPAVGSMGATVAGSVMGTPAYMPYEQGRGLQVDARADVYAIGAVLYHVLSKRAPYDGPDGMAILQALLKEPPPPLAQIAPDVPPELATIVAKAMAREPEHRYPTARELVDDLRRYQNGQMVGVHRYTTRELFGRWAKKHKGALAVALLSFVVLAVIGVVAISRVISANNDAQRDRDLALEQSKAALEARTRAEGSEARAKKSEQLVAVERDRQKFVRERRVEFDHFAHTQRGKKCADCHVIDQKTFTAKAGHPGHDECQGCHDAKSMEGLSNDPKCAFCHLDRAATTKDHTSLRACDSGSVTALKSAGGKTAPCFPHDLKAHRFDDKSQALDCTTCHAVIADKAKWGVKKYASLQDLDTNTIIGQGPLGGIDAMHKACTTGCHAHEGQTGMGAGETKCNMCHPTRDMSEF